MTDKERLETIKELVKKIESILYDEWRQQELTFLIESLYYAGHVDWLIQQAERVHELEKQNKRYREALEAIAYFDEKEEGEATTRIDAKYIARKALEGEE